MDQTKSVEQTIKGIVTRIVHCNENDLTLEST